MENKLQIFNSPEFGELQTLEVNGKIFFPATKAADALGYKRGRDAIQQHCKGAVKYRVPTAGGEQEVIFIDESDLYRLITHSKLPAAEKFEHWIFNEVIPSIRQHGFYLDTTRGDVDPDVVINLCHQIKAQRKKLELALEDNHILEQQVKELAPKATYYDLILNCKDLVSVSEIAKDYGKTAQWLNDYLKNADVQYQLAGQKTWLLKSKYADQGYTQSKTHTYLGSDGENHSKLHTYWTQAGRLFLYHFLKERGILPLIEQNEEELNADI